MSHQGGAAAPALGAGLGVWSVGSGSWGLGSGSWGLGSGWELWDEVCEVRGQAYRRRAGGMGTLGRGRGGQGVQVTGTVLGWHRDWSLQLPVLP